MAGSKQISCRVPIKVYERVRSLVDSGMYMSPSDFARDAIMDKLNAVGNVPIIEIRDYTLGEAKELIVKHLQEHKGEIVYPDDIANEYGMELDVCLEAVKELIKEERIEEVEKR